MTAGGGIYFWIRIQGGKIIYRLFALVVLIVSLLGCHSQIRNSDKKILKGDVCEIIKDIDRNLDVIKKNTREILNGDDNCVLRLLDSLTYKLINKNEIKYLEALDSICQVADGYIGEALWDVGSELFYKNFKGFFQYLYSHRNEKNCLEQFFVGGVSVEINMVKDRLKKEQEIDKYLKDKIIELKLSESEKQYLEQLQSQFNPEILD